MHDGPFLGLQGVHRAEIVGIGPDGRALVLIPTLGATPLFAQSLVPVPTGSAGRTAAVTMMDDEPLILGLIQPALPAGGFGSSETFELPTGLPATILSPISLASPSWHFAQARFLSTMSGTAEWSDLFITHSRLDWPG